MTIEQVTLLLGYMDIRAAIEARQAVHQPPPKEWEQHCEKIRESLLELTTE